MSFSIVQISYISLDPVYTRDISKWDYRDQPGSKVGLQINIDVNERSCNKCYIKSYGTN